MDSDKSYQSESEFYYPDEMTNDKEKENIISVRFYFSRESTSPVTPAVDFLPSATGGTQDFGYSFFHYGPSGRWIKYILNTRTELQLRQILRSVTTLSNKHTQFYLFRGKTRGLQKAYSVKRKTPLPLNVIPRQQPISTATFYAKRNLNQQGSYWHPMMQIPWMPPISEVEPSEDSASPTQSFFSLLIGLSRQKILGVFPGYVFSSGASVIPVLSYCLINYKLSVIYNITFTIISSQQYTFRFRSTHVQYSR